MGLFGSKNRRVREIAHEVLKPLGVDLNSLKETSRRDFESEMRRVVNNDKDDELYRRQDDPRKDDRR